MFEENDTRSDGCCLVCPGCSGRHENKQLQHSLQSAKTVYDRQVKLHFETGDKVSYKSFVRKKKSNKSEEQGLTFLLAKSWNEFGIQRLVLLNVSAHPNSRTENDFANNSQL